MRLFRRLAATLSCLLVSGVAEGQETRPVGAWRPVANPIAGWHALGPVLLSVTAVAGFGTGNLNIPEPRSTFVLAAVEPGIHAGRASLIFAHWLRWEGGAVLRASALRFWSGNRTYLGGEAQWVISVLPLGVRIGAFRPTADTPGPRKTLWLADLSVMY
ncbi:MAG TPA: hypothetical protein VFZ73_02150 [Gemmatimonadaceae bacterium]